MRSDRMLEGHKRTRFGGFFIAWRKPGWRLSLWDRAKLGKRTPPRQLMLAGAYLPTFARFDKLEAPVSPYQLIRPGGVAGTCCQGTVQVRTFG